MNATRPELQVVCSRHARPLRTHATGVDLHARPSADNTHPLQFETANALTGSLVERPREAEGITLLHRFAAHV